MIEDSPSTGDSAEIDRLRSELEEARQTIQAIRQGRVDALVVTEDNEPRIFTLEGSDTAYRVMVEVMNEGAVTIDEDGLIMFSNALFSRMVGLPPGAVVGRHIEDFTNERDAAALAAFLKLASSRPSRREFVLRRSDGADLPVLASASEFVAAGVPSVCLVVTDLTEQKEAERRREEILQEMVEERTVQLSEANEELEKFKFLVEHAAEGIALVDRDRKLVFVNQAFCEIYDRPAGALVGKRVDRVGLRPDEVEKLDMLVPEAVSESGNWSGEIAIERPDGTSVQTLANVGLLRDESGVAVGAVMMMTDISTLKETERRLIDVNRELDAYAHTVSHDLRSPLTAVILANELLRDAAGSEDARLMQAEIEESASTIARNIGKAYSLVNDLLAIAESGQRPVKAERVDVTAIVRRIVEEREMRMREKGVAVEMDDDLGSIRASETQVYQVFSNIIGNSIEHNDNPRPVTTIRHVGDWGGEHRFLIRDNGSGLPESTINEIFTPFMKHEDTGSYGMGLAIVKKIVDVYGGSIRAYNEDGVCFEFSLRDFSG
jgi:two-component system CheB/CheR fusion protein